jgi:hypothetical protein
MRPVVPTGQALYSSFSRENAMRGMLWLAIGLMILGGTGCAKKDGGAANGAQQPAVSAESQTPSESHEGEGEPVNTSGSTSELFARIHEQEGQLEQVIASGQLNEVHRKAFAIRDLVAAAAAQAPASQQAALEPHVGEVRTIADALDEAGDSGDLAKTKSEFQELKTHLRTIESVLGAGAP